MSNRLTKDQRKIFKLEQEVRLLKKRIEELTKSKKVKSKKSDDSCPACETGILNNVDWGPISGYMCDTCGHRKLNKKKD